MSTGLGSSRRSIPAWAGETALYGFNQESSQVYPRVGGGNKRQRYNYPTASGLSPRGRGKPPFTPGSPLALGSIPAWAGETLSLTCTGSISAVYPRVGGGNTAACLVNCLAAGLSPRGRGKRANMRANNCDIGSIPAWAGETYAQTLTAPRREVYPRVGGGNTAHDGGLYKGYGLSPRGRGKHFLRRIICSREGSIPAWAGETTTRITISDIAMVYPRVGGGNR